MKVTHASIGAIALIWLSPVSQAAPLSSATGGLKVGTVRSGIEKTGYRVCWLKHGYYWKCDWPHTHLIITVATAITILIIIWATATTILTIISATTITNPTIIIDTAITINGRIMVARQEV